MRDDLRDVRAVLWQWGRTDRRIAELMEEQKLAGARVEALYDVGGVRAPDGAPRSTVPGDPVYQAFLSIERERELFRAEIEECERQAKAEMDFRAAVDRALKRLPSAQRDVVRMRYMGGGHTWPYVAIMLGMSESNAKLMDQRACEALRDIITVSKSF